MSTTASAASDAASTASAKFDAYTRTAKLEMEDSRRSLLERAETVDRKLLGPATRRAHEFAEQQGPVVTLILGLFAVLSFVPVALFLLFTTSTILAVVGSAVAVSACSIFFFISLAALVLGSTLVFTAAGSLLAGGFIFSSYLAHRLFSTLRHSDSLSEATDSFVTEVKEFFQRSYPAGTASGRTTGTFLSSGNAIIGTADEKARKELR